MKSRSDVTNVATRLKFGINVGSAVPKNEFVLHSAKMGPLPPKVGPPLADFYGLIVRLFNTSLW
jgi:hypothetical protein